MLTRKDLLAVALRHVAPELHSLRDETELPYMGLETTGGCVP